VLFACVNYRSVYAVTDGVAWFLEAKAYHRLTRTELQREATACVCILKQVPLLRGLPDEKLEQFAAAMVPSRYTAGQPIVRDGQLLVRNEEGEQVQSRQSSAGLNSLSFFVVLEGVVNVREGAAPMRASWVEGVAPPSLALARGEFYGEPAFRKKTGHSRLSSLEVGEGAIAASSVLAAAGLEQDGGSSFKASQGGSPTHSNDASFNRPDGIGRRSAEDEGSFNRDDAWEATADEETGAKVLTISRPKVQALLGDVDELLAAEYSQKVRGSKRSERPRDGRSRHRRHRRRGRRRRRHPLHPYPPSQP
jgi:hypothetical protein